MTEKKYYLKQNVFVEPMINQWYAWGQLVAPQTLAMMFTNLHTKIMESYIKTPQMHANAVKNPKMLGGPFIDLPGNQTQVVQELLDRSKAEMVDMMALAEAIKELELIMMNEAKGHSLLSLYSKIPEILQGFVELGYDLNNNPSIRFIESLLYKSKYYQERRQGLRIGLVEGDHRAFVLSTPRFPSKDTIHYQMAFSNPAIDRLFSMRETARSLDEIAEFMPEDPEQKELFMSFFTEEAPEFRGRDRGTLAGKFRVKYFGHATILLESDEVSIMCDPVISYEIADKTIPRYSYADLPEKIDYVLITHGHQDHILYETLLQIRHKIGTIVVPPSNGGFLQDPALKLMLKNTGFTNVVELDEMASLEVPGGKITGLPFFGEHGDIHVRSKLAFHVELNGKSVVCAADSNNISPPLYDKIREIMGPVDRIFRGMECEGAPMSWLYGPLLTKPLERRMDQSRRFDGSDCERGLQLVESMGGRGVYVYAMGQEPWLTFVSSIKYTEKSKPIVESNRLVEACQEKGMEAERLFGRKEIFV